MANTPMTAAAQVGSGQLQRELDLKRLYMVNPALTPLSSSLDMRGDQPKQTFCEWLAQYPQTVDSTATPDNAPTTNFGRRLPVLIQGRTHYFRDPYAVSKTANAQASGGGINRNELGKQRADSLERMRYMVEQQWASISDSAPDNGSTVGSTGRGIGCWLQPSLQTELTLKTEVQPAAGCSYTDTWTNFLANPEDKLVTMVGNCFDQLYAEVEFDLFAGRLLSDQIDILTKVYPVASTSSQPMVRYNESTSSKYKRKVDVLTIGTGTVRKHLVGRINWYKPTGGSVWAPRQVNIGGQTVDSRWTGYLMNLDMWGMRDLVPLNHEELAKDGSGYRGQYEQQTILWCGNPMGQGVVAPSGA